MSGNQLRRSRLVALGAVLTLATTTVAACGNDSDTASADGAIKIGGTFPLSGPAAVAGQRGTGIKLYFDYLNDNGGIDGRQVEYELKDDAYNPSATVQMTRQLVEQDHVVATLGSIGTPTQLAVRDYLNEQKIPQLFISSDDPAFALDYEDYPYTSGWEQPNFLTGAVYAKDLVQQFPTAKVGVFYQNDDVGKGYLKGFKDELDKQTGVEIVAEQGYDRTATSVTSQISALKDSGADTLVSFAVPGFTPKALSAAYSQNWVRKFTYVDPNSLSSAEMNTVVDQTGTPDAVEGVRSATIFKDPQEPSLQGDAGLALFEKIMQEYCSKCDASSVYYLQGMSQGWAFAELLKGIEGDITSESILEAAHNIDQPDNPFLLSGILVKAGEDDNQPISQIHMAEFVDGTFKLTGDLLAAE